MKIISVVNEAFRIGTVQHNYEITKLAELMYERKPKNLLEIGSKNGATFYIWCKLSHSHGKKISVDLKGIRKKFRHQANRWAKNVVLIRGNSSGEMVFNQVVGCLNDQKLDFLFIDGCHNYEMVKSDYEMYVTLVGSGGFVAFHDIVTPRDQWANYGFGSHIFWKELQGKKVEFIEPSNQPWGGIGVLFVE